MRTKVRWQWAQARGQWPEVRGLGIGAGAVILAAVVGLAGVMVAGCGTLDRLYTKQVTTTSAPSVQVVTNMVVATNLLVQVIERTNIVLVTNSTTGSVSGYATREALATNLVQVVQTNLVPVFYTNLVQVQVTNLVAKPGAEAAIAATGSVANTFFPGVGSIVALALGGLYHGYRQVRNKNVNAALVQGVETARAVLQTTPQGQAADDQFVRWLASHQKEAGVFQTVSTLVDSFVDNDAAKESAEEILARVQRAGQGRAVAVPAGPAPSLVVPAGAV